MRAQTLHRTLRFVIAPLLLFATAHGQARAQNNLAHRRIDAVAASGSGLAVAVNEDRSAVLSQLIFVSPATNTVLWHIDNLPTIGSVTQSPDGTTVAVGLVGVPDSALGVLLVDARTGKQMGGLGVDLDRNFMPGTVYPRFGSGVSQLLYSRDGALLYGLSNDTLFLWDVAGKKYLWTVDVPAVIEAPADLPDSLPYGHATGFILSPDGRQIAAIRDALRVGSAGRAKPIHFIKRMPSRPMLIEGAAFSADSKILAAGEFGTAGQGKPGVYATDLWIDGSTRAIRIDGCGGAIAWSKAPDIFACQNDAGAHLRNIHDPGKDIGAAGPVGDLPILKVGDSLWVAAYRATDWKDPAKPLPLSLIELGTGKRITVTLPARQ